MSDHWKDLADKLGTPSLNPVPKKSSGKAPKTAEPTEHREPVAKQEEVPEPVAARPAEANPKRSSWDSLARLFGFGESKSEPVAPPPPPEPKPTPELEIDWGRSEPKSRREPRNRDQERASEPRQETSRTEIRSESASRPEPKPVADQPRHSKRGKKSSPSMWDEPTAAEPVASETVFVDEVESARNIELDEPPRRDSRRRRGGHRDRQADTRAKEPIEPVEMSRAAPDVPDEEEPVGDVERRGRRRRPRRGQRQLESESAVEDREVIRDETIDTDDDLVSEERDESEEPAPRTRSRRRGRRGGRDRNDKERTTESAAPLDDDVDLGLETDHVDDGSEEAPTRHIKVPTWADAIAVLVEHNTENHRRGADGGHPKRRHHSQGPREGGSSSSQPRRGRGRSNDQPH